MFPILLCSQEIYPIIICLLHRMCVAPFKASFPQMALALPKECMLGTRLVPENQLLYRVTEPL